MKFLFRKLDSELSLPKTQSNLAQQQKTNWLFRKNNRLFIPVNKYTLKLKSLRDTVLNQELHPVFPETTGESTKQSNLDYLHITSKKWHWSPKDTHFLWLNTYTTKNVDLDNLKSTQHFSASHTRVYTKYRRITLVTEWSEINTRWKSYSTLSWSKQSQSNF